MSKPITIFFKRNSRAAINAQLAEMNELIEKGYRFKVTNDRKSCVVLFPIPRFIMEIPGEESEEDEVVSEEVISSDESFHQLLRQDVAKLKNGETSFLVLPSDTDENGEYVYDLEIKGEDGGGEFELKTPCEVTTRSNEDVLALLAELEELSGMKEIVDAFVKKVGVEIPADKIHPNAKKKWLKEYLTSLKG